MIEMDRTKSLGGVQGKYSTWSSEELEREIQFGKRSEDLGMTIPPELLAKYVEIMVELMVRNWVNGRAKGEYERGFK